MRLPEPAENVADAPNAEADGDQAKDDAHDGAADPIGGGLVNTSEHEIRSVCLDERPNQADFAGIYGPPLGTATHADSAKPPLAWALALC
jgi:hypothetical protein